MVEIRYATGDEPEQTDTLASRVGAFRRPLIVAAAMALVAIPAGLQVWKVALGYGLFAAALLAWPSGKASARARAKADSRSALARPKDFQLLDALDLPAIVFDEETFVVRQNAASSKLIGAYPERAALSAWIRSPAILELVARVIARGEPESVEHVERVPSERWHEVRAAPIAARPITGRRLFVLTFRDLTEARRMDRMRTDFVANASHELKTPLASLMGFIETMQGPARDDEAARTEFLGIMLDQAQRMARLIDDLLSLSRLEMRAHVAPKGQVDLNAAIGHVIDTLKPMAGELGVEINLTAPDDPVLVTGDVDELIQVFSNQIAGSSTVLPYATIVAEAFGENFDFPTPVVESGGSSTGLRRFCEGVGENTTDIANSSRSIRDSEIETCAENGVTDIIEVRFGYDGIVFASDINGPSFAFTPSDWYLALAPTCPSTAKWSPTRTPCGRT
jgi:two-component system phosphate regulon sensor histidine kinase PhoR